MSIRSFLKRYPDSYNSWETLYKLTLWINLFTNRLTIDGRQVTPYEIHLKFEPYMDRFLKTALPLKNYAPKQSTVNMIKWIDDHTKSPKKTVKKPHVKIGQQVMYKKYGAKDPTLLPATVVSTSDDTCNIKIKSGVILTRLYKDIIA